MKKKAIGILILCMVLGISSIQAQSDSTAYLESYKKFIEQAQQGYNDFKTEAYEEFERFLAEAWTEYESFSGVPSAFSLQKPESVPVMKTAAGNDDGKNAPKYRVEAIPPSETGTPSAYTVSGPDAINVNFYGCKLGFHLPESLKIKAKSTKESHISNYYESMRQNKAAQTFQKELDATVNRMGLNEWGYFALLRTISEKAFDNMNDRVLFCFFMLHNHGFKARVGRGQKSGQLILLLAIDKNKEVYSQTFFRINGAKFYAVYGGEKGENTYSYNEKADESGLQDIGLDFKHRLNMAPCDKKRILHLNKADVDMALPYSTSNLRYYDEMPMTDFPVYAETPISNDAEQALTETFGTLAKKHDKTQLVDVMLNFVQTAFAYKIDEKQFGREKYFFPEEVIGYPFSDCEDRSALFAWLVRQYTDFEVIGILYADHLATAVCYGDDAQPSGKSFIHNGKRYVFCDPTYENAPIGTVMPKYTDAKFEIIELN